MTDHRVNPNISEYLAEPETIALMADIADSIFNETITHLAGHPDVVRDGAEVIPILTLTFASVLSIFVERIHKEARNQGKSERDISEAGLSHKEIMVHFVDFYKQRRRLTDAPPMFH